MLVIATLGLLAGILGPWVMSTVRALMVANELSQLAWSQARLAAQSGTVPPRRLDVPGLGAVAVTWSGSLGRCGFVTVDAEAEVTMPRYLGVLPPRDLLLREAATVPDDVYVNGPLVGPCGAL